MVYECIRRAMGFEHAIHTDPVHVQSSNSIRKKNQYKRIGPALIECISAILVEMCSVSLILQLWVSNSLSHSHTANLQIPILYYYVHNLDINVRTDRENLKKRIIMKWTKERMKTMTAAAATMAGAERSKRKKESVRNSSCTHFSVRKLHSLGFAWIVYAMQLSIRLHFRTIYCRCCRYCHCCCCCCCFNFSV